MAKIPTYRDAKVKPLCALPKESVIVPRVPTPAYGYIKQLSLDPIDKRHEIDGDTVLMRALPRSRFRSAFGEDVVLPLGTADRLEDFEKGLRNAGFITPSQCLVKLSEPADKIGMQCAKFIVSKTVHRVRPSGRAELPFTEDPQPRRSVNSQSRPKSDSVPLRAVDAMARKTFETILHSKKPSREPGT